MRQSTILVSLVFGASCAAEPTRSAVAVLPQEESASSAVSEPNATKAPESSDAQVAVPAQKNADPVEPSKTEPAAQTATPSSKDKSPTQVPAAPVATTQDDAAHASKKHAARDFALSSFDREARVREQFAELTSAEQREFIDWFANDSRDFQTFQNTLIKFVVQNEPTDRGLWPDFAPLEPYDSKKHAPAQIIERHALEAGDPITIAAQDSILGAVAPRRLTSGWMYDYVSREPRRVANEGDPKRQFDNALLGLPPGWDYAEALVERALDDGSVQKIAAAFAHPYTDRTGGVYPEITLYDAWASNAPFEVPDVDALGIIHDALNDWNTWKAVVPPDQQQPLYDKIGELFRELHHHRSLRHNLARAYLCGSTELRDQYENNLRRFHALWDDARSMPSELAPTLPASAKWTEFLEGLVARVDADETKVLHAMRRQLTLDNDARYVRSTLLRYFDQYLAEQGKKK